MCSKKSFRNVKEQNSCFKNRRKQSKNIKITFCFIKNKCKMSSSNKFRSRNNIR